MSVIIDLIIVAVIAICIIIGYVRGLTGCLIKILSFVLSLVIAFILFVPVSNFVIENTQIDENLEKSIREMIISDNKSSEEEIPTAMSDYINKRAEEIVDNAKEEVVNATARDISQTIVKAGTWIALFIVARIALIFLKLITSLISKLPVIKQCDKLGGIIYGVLEGLLITYFALAVISFITPITNKNLSENINKSYLGSQMYNLSLIHI